MGEGWGVSRKRVGWGGARYPRTVAVLYMQSAPLVWEVIFWSREWSSLEVVTVFYDNDWICILFQRKAVNEWT